MRFTAVLHSASNPDNTNDCFLSYEGRQESLREGRNFWIALGLSIGFTVQTQVVVYLVLGRYIEQEAGRR